MSEFLETEDLQVLTDIGFIAVSNGLIDHATAIFGALRAMRPDGETAYLGEAMIDILTGKSEDAVAKLKSAPQTDAVQTFLGIALAQAQQVDAAKELLGEVCKTAADTPFAEVAKNTLDVMAEG